MRKAILVAAVAVLVLAMVPSPAAMAVPGWAQARPMSMARAEHTATLLQNGTVLVAGGIAAADPAGPFEATASAEVYNPRWNSWRRVAPMHFARSGHAAVRLAGGRVLVVGGGTNIEQPPPPEVYTPWLNRWTVVAPPLYPLPGVSATLLLSGRVFVYPGGECGTPEIYTPWTNSWTFGASVDLQSNPVVPCDGLAVRLPNGHVLIHGNAGSDSAGVGYPPSIEYTPQTDSWAVIPHSPFDGTTPFVHFGEAMTLLSTGQALLSGGSCRFCEGPERAAWLFDAASSTWSPTGPMVYARDGHVLAPLPGGRALAVAGYAALDISDDSTRNPRSAEIFDSATGTWTPTADTLVPHSGATLTPLADGRLLLIGGSSATVELYRP